MRRLCVLLILLVGCSVRSDFEEISRLEDTRNPGDGTLAAYLSSSSPGIRSRAARAAGRIQSRELVPMLAPLLDDTDPAVILEAAFALGQIGLVDPDTRPEVEDLLLERASRIIAIPPGTAVEVAAALGKVGGRRSREQLVQLLRDPRPQVRAGAASALARRPDPDLIDPLARLLKDSAPSVRASVCQALVRCGGRAAIPHLAAALHDTIPLVRQLAARALGFKGEDAVEPLADLLNRGEWNPHVHIAAVAALVRSGARAASPTLSRCIHSQWPQVRAAAALALAAAGQWDVLDPLARDEATLVRQYVAQSCARSEETEAYELLRLLAQDPLPLIRASALEAMGARTADAPEIRMAMNDEEALVRAASVASLANRCDPSDLPTLVAAVNDPDQMVVAEAVCAIGRIARDHPDARIMDEDGNGRSLWVFLDDLYHPAAAKPVRLGLAKALLEGPDGASCRVTRLMRDPDIEIRTEVFEALLPFENALRREGCPLPDTDWVHGVRRPLREASEYPSAENLPRVATLLTPKGEFIIRFDGRLAPRAVANFVALARDGFYDGLPFHTVVPDSVIVGGCPRGDGTGGPGYQIRCEVSTARCDRGAVGMVLHGKDTGGSQFFIALSPQPDMNGHVTIFGRVTGGMDVVDRLQPGDRILEVTPG